MPKDLLLLTEARDFIENPTRCARTFKCDFPRTEVLFLSRGDSLKPTESWWDDYSLLSGDLIRSMLGMPRPEKLTALKFPRTDAEKEKFINHIPEQFREYITTSMHQAGMTGAGTMEVYTRAVSEGIMLEGAGRTNEVRVTSDSRALFFDRFSFGNKLVDLGSSTAIYINEGKTLLSGLLVSELSIGADGNVQQRLVDYSLTPHDITACKILFALERLKPLIDFIEPEHQAHFMDATAEAGTPDVAATGAGDGAPAEETVDLGGDRVFDSWLLLEPARPAITHAFVAASADTATLPANAVPEQEADPVPATPAQEANPAPSVPEQEAEITARAELARV